MVFKGKVTLVFVAFFINCIYGKCYDDIQQKHFEIADIDNSGALSKKELCNAMDLDVNGEGCDESFVMLDVTKNEEVTCQETIVAMYMHTNDSRTVRKIFETKVENCGLIPELDLLEIAKANGPLSAFKRGHNELNMKSVEALKNSNVNLTTFVAMNEAFAKLQNEELSDDEKVVKMIQKMDLNRDGIVGCDEFVVNLAKNYL